MAARMTIAITADVSGSKRKLARLLQVLSRTRVLAAVGEAQSLWVARNIKSAGQAGGGLWTAMAPRTLRQRPARASRHHFHAPFQARLVAGIKATKHFAATSVTVAVKARHAPLQHAGGVNQDGRRIPARPLLPSAASLRKATQGALNGLLRQMREAAR